eukprot:153181-Pleurochrysis_carterae.AAC.1
MKTCEVPPYLPTTYLKVRSTRSPSEISSDTTASVATALPCAVLADAADVSAAAVAVAAATAPTAAVAAAVATIAAAVSSAASRFGVTRQFDVAVTDGATAAAAASWPDSAARKLTAAPSELLGTVPLVMHLLLSLTESKVRCKAWLKFWTEV